MCAYKEHFPLLCTHPQMVYLDSAATTQKPAYVLEGVHHYLTHEYANIHRGWYDLSAKSEELYRQARKKCSLLLNAQDDEIIFTSGSTGASNLLVQSLVLSQMVRPGDQIILARSNHHSSILPRQLLGDQAGCTIVWRDVDEQGMLDLDELRQLCATSKVRALVLPHVSNVLGQIEDIAAVRALVGEEVLLIVDASQSIAHIPVDVHAL